MKWKIEDILMVFSGLAFSVAALSGWLYFQDRGSQGPQQDIGSLILKHKAVLFHSAADPILGNPEGDVTLVEFSDYRCPYCKLVHPIVKKVLKKDGHIRFVLKEYPILGPVSFLATKAALASQKQGGYAVFHDAMMSTRSLTKDSIFTIAQEVGLDPLRLRADMDTFADEIKATIEANLALGRTLRLQGTPIFIAGQTLLPGATNISGLERLIAAARLLKAEKP